MNVYFISGLGADRKAFQKITLPQQFSVHYIDWIPNKKHESLEAYVKRLATSIDTSKPFALVGLSFGGMTACMMNEFLHPEKTILISSVSSPKELPWYLKLAGALRIEKLIPISFLKGDSKLMYRFFGAKTESERRLLREFTGTSDPHFIKWALGKIARWKYRNKVNNLVHIHGSKDKIFPMGFVNADVVIQNGSHLMVWTKGAEVSRAVTDALTTHSYKP